MLPRLMSASGLSGSSSITLFVLLMLLYYDLLVYEPTLYFPMRQQMSHLSERLPGMLLWHRYFRRFVVRRVQD
ncbi:hypothetical protein PMIT1303_00035 [Prochlorococcus sp. MIT 1303]|nr:hypothetical protein PMIT1303_00035 [Prochlorococcus sp. MIT 1303]